MKTFVLEDEELRIQGSPRPLHGSVRIDGAKNAALPQLFASMLTSEKVILRNIPTQTVDVNHAIELLRFHGKRVEVDEDVVTIEEPGELTSETDLERSGRIRYSLLLMGALLTRKQSFVIGNPGGCDIGDRKFDLHISGLRELGAEIELQEETISGTVPGRLIGNEIRLYLPTTSGTQNIIFGAVCAEGRSVIMNANTRPETADLCEMLNKMGARTRCENRVVEVEGVDELGGVDHTIMSGWDEAVTYILATGMAGGEVKLQGKDLARNMKYELKLIRDIGIEVFEWGGDLYVAAGRRAKESFDLFTGPYPAINSDMQPLFAAFATQIPGSSTITDLRFTERFSYVQEYQKLGADIVSFGNTAIIKGPARPTGGEVRATDLRAGAGLVLLALAADGDVAIGNASQILRGYQDIHNKLGALT